MIINKIVIDNIKGIGHSELMVDLQPNRPNILVAPNGYGKSSIATAFLAAKMGPIVLKPEECHNEDPNNQPRLSIFLNNREELLADSTRNTILPEYSIHVANNQLIPNAKAKHFGRITQAKANLDIKPTHVIRKVPRAVHFGYTLSSMKRAFRGNNKVLLDISSLYGNYMMLVKVEKDINFHAFDLKPYKKAMEVIIPQINTMKGTAVVIKNEILQLGLFNIDIPEWVSLVANIMAILHIDEIDAALCAWQYVKVRKDMGTSAYNKAMAYSAFIWKKQQIDETIKSMNPVQERFKIESRVEGDDLVINWPKAHQISNGQRDIMVFIAQLLECEYQSSKNCILIIDEFFDYLDDANLVAFQYYVSMLIDRFRRNKRLIFPILLTHLDPNYLKHFCFNDKRLNICYLRETNAKISKEMVKLVAKREEPSIKDVLDTYFFHYHPESAEIDITDELKSLGLNKDWGCPVTFRNKVDRQTRIMYFETNKSFDPLAVCFSVRMKIEENVYNLLSTEADREEFLQTHGTNEKLSFAQKKGVSVSETYHLLGIIYNHPLHEADENMAQSLGMKLDNLVIKNMIFKLW